MRQKQLRVILTFPAAVDAMAMESYGAAHQVPGRLIPLPSAVSAGCGLCWSAPPEAREAEKLKWWYWKDKAYPEEGQDEPA